MYILQSSVVHIRTGLHLLPFLTVYIHDFCRGVCDAAPTDADRSILLQFTSLPLLPRFDRLPDLFPPVVVDPSFTQNTFGFPHLDTHTFGLFVKIKFKLLSYLIFLSCAEFFLT